MGGQMDEVITRISEHEGGAVDHCHHQANSWRQKPLQQLADFKHAHAQADALSPGELPSPVLGKKKRLWSLPQLDSYFTSSVCYDQNDWIVFLSLFQNVDTHPSPHVFWCF